MGDGTDKDKDAVEGEGDEEEIEVSVVPLAHTVAHPGTVVVEALHTVVTDGAVAGAGRAEYLAGEAELELHSLTFHLRNTITTSGNNPTEGRLGSPEPPWSWAAVCRRSPPRCQAARSLSRYTRPLLWWL